MFGAHLSPRHPVLPGKEMQAWTTTTGSKSKKKFSYKARSNKIPLRDKIKDAEAEQILEEADKAARARANRAISDRIKRLEELKAVKTASAPQPTARKSILKKSNSDQSASNKAPSDYVTLTQDQLATILASLTKAQDVMHANKVQVDFDNNHNLKIELDKSSVQHSTESAPSTGQSQNLESVLHLAKNAVTNPRSTKGKKQRNEEGQSDGYQGDSKNDSHKKLVLNFNLDEQESRHGKQRKKGTDKKTKADEITRDAETPDDIFVRRATKVVIVDADDGATEKTNIISTHLNEKELGKVNEGTQIQHINAGEAPVAGKELELSPRQKQLLIPKAHMTKAEQKRLEWQFEKEAVEKLQKEQQKFAELLTQRFATNEVQSINPETSEQPSIEKVKENSPSKSRPSQKQSNKMPPTRTSSKNDAPSKQVVVEPDAVPGLEGLYSNTNANNNDESTEKTNRLYAEQISTTAPQLDAIQYSTIPAPLTKAELKRMQWEKERAAALPDYDPWGRPGAGVGPDHGRQPDLASYTRQQQQQSSLQQSSVQQQSSQQQQSIQQQQPQQQQAQLTLQQQLFQTGASQPPHQYVQHPQGFREPDRGVPTGLLGLENPPKSIHAPPPVRSNLTKAELLKLKWAAEREENQVEYNPYGRPGAGAPIRTDSGTVLNNYQSRLNYVLRRSQEKEADPGYNQQQVQSAGFNDPAAQSVGVGGLESSGNANIMLTNSFNSSINNSGAHARGQIINMDVATLREREDLRRRELQHQEEIKRQVEEKQRLKQEERMKKVREEAQEEAKLRAEMSNEQQQHAQKRNQDRRREAQQISTVDVVAESIQKAKREAEMLKAQKRLEKLKAAGHDISHLKAAYEDKFSPRPGLFNSSKPEPESEHLTSRSNHVEPSKVPGLELSPRQDLKPSPRQAAEGIDESGYTHRSLTPSKYKGISQRNPVGKENRSPVKEFGVQTDDGSLESRRTTRPEAQGRNIKKQVRVISGPKARKAVKADPKDKEPKPWGWKNQRGKKFELQSKRDPFYEEKKERAERLKQDRTEKLLKLVEANKGRIPQANRGPPENSVNKMSSRNPQTKKPSPRNLQINEPSPRNPQSIKVSSHSTTTTQQKVKSTEPGNHLPTVGSNYYDEPSSYRGDTTRSVKASTTDDRAGYNLQIAQNLRVTPTEEFIPFTRSDVVLDPSGGQEPSAISREPTQAALAREAYYKTMQPAQYGIHMHNIKDSSPAKQQSNHNRDPLYNPSLLTNHPTERQKQVLESLRQMKQGLLARQRDIDSTASPDHLQQDPYV